MIAMFIMSGRPSRSEEDIKKFKEALADGIINSLERYNRCDLDVDYNACQILAEAGSVIGLDDMLDFPSKTRMHIDHNLVEVYEGGQYTTLWQSKENEKGLK